MSIIVCWHRRLQRNAPCPRRHSGGLRLSRFWGLSHTKIRPEINTWYLKYLTSASAYLAKRSHVRSPRCFLLQSLHISNLAWTRVDIHSFHEIKFFDVILSNVHIVSHATYLLDDFLHSLQLAVSLQVGMSTSRGSTESTRFDA